jgi:hypothetical protein
MPEIINGVAMFFKIEVHCASRRGASARLTHYFDGAEPPTPPDIAGAVAACRAHFRAAVGDDPEIAKPGPVIPCGEQPPSPPPAPPRRLAPVRFVPSVKGATPYLGFGKAT